MDIFGGKMMCMEKDAEDGVARKKETEKANKEVYGYGESGHGRG